MISTTGYIARFSTELLTLKYVFPGGSVPSLPRTLELLDQHGLHVVDIEELSGHYQRTAEEWLINLEDRWSEIQAVDPQVFTERFRRIWTYYLSGVIEGFAPGGGNLGLHHITFTKGKGYYPTDRSFLYS
jgi:cyclopropane-fatty-acyl-phospholipid synthase